MNYRVTFAAKNGQPEQTASFRTQQLADAYARDVQKRAAGSPAAKPRSSGDADPASSSAKADDALPGVEGRNHD